MDRQRLLVLDLDSDYLRNSHSRYMENGPSRFFCNELWISLRGPPYYGRWFVDAEFVWFELRDARMTITQSWSVIYESICGIVIIGCMGFGAVWALMLADEDNCSLKGQIALFIIAGVLTFTAAPAGMLGGHYLFYGNLWPFFGSLTTPAFK